MITAEKHLGDLKGAELPGLGEHGVFEESRTRVRLFNEGVRVSHKSFEKTRNSLSKNHRCDLAAVQDVVTDRKLDDLDAGFTVVLGDTRVDPLVAPTGDDDLIGAREILNPRLGQRRSRRRRDREDATRRGLSPIAVALRERRGKHLVKGASPHIRTHYHARATAVGGVIDATMLAGGPLAQVVRLEMHEAGILCLPHQRETKRRKIVRENRNKVEAHGVSRPRAPTRHRRRTGRGAHR